MKILITGSKGFIGRNLSTTLVSLDHEVLHYDSSNTLAELKEMCSICDFVVHLAGVNRSVNTQDFYDGNQGLVESLIAYLQEYNNKAPVLLSSSVQASLDNDYGKSKLGGEVLLESHGRLNNSSVYIYRFSNLFGKWSRPNYNTVIATWCYNISRDLPIEIKDPSIALNLMYIDDVVAEIVGAIEGNPTRTSENFCTVLPTYNKTLGEISELLYKFKCSRKDLYVPNMSPGFESKLYSTYLSFLPEDSFSYPLKMNIDDRGSFTEFLKTKQAGQVSINVSKPGITKGQHWHHSKNEKFLVVSGQGLIQLRDVFNDTIIEYLVSGDSLEVVDIPTGYTHNIINVGTSDLVTVMWVNQPFDPGNPDTLFLPV